MSTVGRPSIRGESPGFCLLWNMPLISRLTYSGRHELLVHYDWHQDMQTEHMIETALLSEQTTPPYVRDAPNVATPPRKAHRVRHDGEIVAVSFVSGSDLKARTFFFPPAKSRAHVNVGFEL